MNLQDNLNAASRVYDPVLNILEETGGEAGLWGKLNCGKWSI